MNPIQIIEKLIPQSVLEEIASVLKKGSSKDGNGVLTYNKTYCYYLWKMYKHLVRWGLGFRYDHDSGQSHLAHAIVRLMQMLLKYKESGK